MWLCFLVKDGLRVSVVIKFKKKVVVKLEEDLNSKIRGVELILHARSLQSCVGSPLRSLGHP